MIWTSRFNWAKLLKTLAIKLSVSPKDQSNIKSSIILNTTFIICFTKQEMIKWTFYESVEDAYVPYLTMRHRYSSLNNTWQDASNCSGIQVKRSSSEKRTQFWIPANFTWFGKWRWLSLFSSFFTASESFFSLSYFYRL